jgi:hypothetical protein
MYRFRLRTIYFEAVMWYRSWRLPRRRHFLEELVEDRCARCGKLAPGRDVRTRFLCFNCIDVRRLYVIVGGLVAALLTALFCLEAWLLWAAIR